MLTAIRAWDRQKVEARQEPKGQVRYFCPECAADLILKKGRVNIHHFAHKAWGTCHYTEGESNAHRQAKQEIFDALKAYGNLSPELEKPLGPVRPDIYFEFNALKIAIEVQISALSMDRIIARTIAYERLGVHVLWLPIHEPRLLADPFTPKVWERWLHAAYFGRVYYWISGDALQPVHFGPYSLYVPERSWYSRGEGEQSAGGYSRTSKKYKTVECGNEIRLGDGTFRARRRDAWKGGDMDVPASLLLLDTQPCWWEIKGQAK